MSIPKGAPNAAIALTHRMLTVVYQVLGRGEEYVEMGGDYYDRRLTGLSAGCYATP